VLHAGDRLVLAGPAAAILGLHGVPGLSPATDHRFGAASGRRHLVEVVLSDRCPLVGERVGQGSFRRRYGAAIIAVARHGEAVGGVRQADWVLRPGDALLVEARSGFQSHPDRDRDFWMLTEHGAADARPGWRALASLGITVAMCTIAATGLVTMLWAALGAVIAIVAFRVMSVGEARAAIDLQVVIAIAASFALGEALERSGAAAGVAGALTSMGGDSPWMTLAAIYVATAITTELITNNAAALLILPIAVAAADHLGVSWMPFALAVMFAASASFMTPIGYATNLMVWGPGGYTFGDFLRLGGILQLVVAVVSIALIPVIWPFAAPH
jgi:di/tricarboxylate transporter